MELTTVTDTEVVFFDGLERVCFDGFRPDTWVEVAGHDVRTMPAPGELLARIATVNDVHFGETEAGKIEGSVIGPVCSVPDGASPYPEVMNAAAVTEISAADPDLVVAKGDLTSHGIHEEYDRFLEVYGAAFGDRLLHVRGNHESYHGLGVATWSTQVVHLDGVTVALLDTSRDGQVNGSLSVEQLAWLDALAAEADRPVMVMGHHPVWNPEVDPRRDDTFGIRPDDSEALFALFRRRPALAGYWAGHTHRNHRADIGEGSGRPFVEVACVKDFPGAWAEYRVYDRCIVQIVHRIGDPAALAWTEQTRHMYEGGYQAYAFGRLDERCFALSVG